MSKKPQSYNLELDVIKEISRRANMDERKNSDWLNRYLRKQFKLDVKTETKKKPEQVNDKVVGYVPCSDGDFGVVQSYIDVWSNAYPDINIGEQLNKIVAWLESNPKKTKSGCKRFINSWLNRAQNSASSMIKANGDQRLRGLGKTSGNLSACEDFLND